MASCGGGEAISGGREELKNQFTTREGIYRLVSAVEFHTSRPLTYVTNNTSPAPGTSGSSPPVRLSFINLNRSQNSTDSNNPSNTSTPTSSTPRNSDLMLPDNDTNPEIYESNRLLCLNIGKELYIYPFMDCRKSVDISKPIDKRVYKGTNPTCHVFGTNYNGKDTKTLDLDKAEKKSKALESHDVNLQNASYENLSLLIGFSGGQIQLVDPISKGFNKLFNEDRLIDKTRVTCIRWVPNSLKMFLVSHGSGYMYLYNSETTCGNTPPHFHSSKQGYGYSICVCKSKSPRNPLNRWTLGEGAIINEFAFSPCGQYLAIVSQDGFLRIFRYETLELVGLTRSYFGGLLCVCWSPDGKIVCVGGEDDLVTFWSFKERRVVARGQGHKSWVAVVAFDPYTTTYGDNDSNNEDCVTVESGGGNNGNPSNSDFQSSGVFSCDSSNTSAGSTSTMQQTNNNNSNSTQGSSSCAHNNNNDNNNCVKQNNVLNNHNSHHSRTSKFRNSENLRLSVSESSNTRIPACYRVGSVGQDTQILLWDLTEDVLKQPFGKSESSRAPLDLNPNFHSNSKQLCNSHNNPSATSASSSDTTQTNCINNWNIDSSKDSDNVNSSSGSNVNLSPSGTITANNVNGNGNGSENSSSGHSHSILSIRFGALSFGGGDKEKSNKDKKERGEHKRNFSLSSSKTDKKDGNSGSWKSSLGLGTNINNIEDPLKLIGSHACPRLNECPLLEPLVCKKISHERLTSLVFREESIVTAGIDGVVCTWSRPTRPGYGDVVSQL